ncbi:hypothetical protein QBC40DRAFT_287927 [Triangularia verruculosa]|uniref:Fungal N-terminal domain-containing protein n=1 Tax=Triangularia verruculosa TaxID=2587418 RepID=A0AAN7ARQ8_9PEZI|nr:hypothetical protein QBC40DRAFT_287927 [Triangularia verruculosa]
MSLPFEISQIHGALALAYRVIEIGWSDVHDAHQQYLEFRQDIEDLTNNLHNLAGAIGQARRGSLLSNRPTTATANNFHHVLGSFTAVLEDCLRLLERQATYGLNRGPIYNLRWFLLVKDDVMMLRDRIAFLNIKLSVAFKALEIETSDGTRRLVVGVGELLLQRIDLLETRVSTLLGQPRTSEPERAMEIPQPLEDLLATIALSRYESLSNITLSQGIDETIFYLDRATRWHLRRQSGQATEQILASQFANMIRAYWTLQATKSGNEYVAASSRPTIENFERDFPRLGMTVQRYLHKLGERIFECHDALAQIGDQTPTLAQVQEALHRESQSWENHCFMRPQQHDDGDPRRGEGLFNCRLQDINSSEQNLEIWQHDEKDDQHLTMITCGANRADRVYQFDRTSVMVIPSDDSLAQGNEFYSVVVNPGQVGGQTGFRLAFHSKGALFSFQQFLTGYKVVDDLFGAKIILQQADGVFGGTQRRSTGRVQLWSSTVRPTGRALPKELRSSSTSTLRNLPGMGFSLNTPPPILPPLDSFSRLTLSQEPGLTPATSPNSSTRSIETPPPIFSSASPVQASAFRQTPSPHGNRLSGNSYSSQTSWRHPMLLAQATPHDNQRFSPRSDEFQKAATMPFSPIQRNDTNTTRPLPRRSSMALSVMSQTSTPSIASSTRSANLIQVDSRGTLGCIIGAPEPPRLVVFLRSATPTEPHSLLVIDINSNVRINPDLCSCKQGQTEHPRARQQVNPSQCCKVVLQPTGGGTKIFAKETATLDEKKDGKNKNSKTGSGTGSASWNLASAGRFQQYNDSKEGGMKEVKRLKLVTIEFASVEARRRFVTNFNDLQELHSRYAVV